MACLLDVPLGAGVASGAVVLLLGIMALAMFRSRRPDPKMELLLTLMRDFPKDEHNGNTKDEGSEPDSPGLLGEPGTHIRSYRDQRPHYKDPDLLYSVISKRDVDSQFGPRPPRLRLWRSRADSSSPTWRASARPGPFGGVSLVDISVRMRTPAAMLRLDNLRFLNEIPSASMAP